MTKILRALCSAALFMLVACGGGEQAPVTNAPAAKTSALPSGAQQAAQAKTNRATAPTNLIPPNIKVEYYQGYVFNCTKTLTLKNVSSEALAMDMARERQSGCEIDGIYDSKWWRVPTLDVVGVAYLFASDPVYSTWEVLWGPNGETGDSFSGSPYGSISCPESYKPYDQMTFDAINNKVIPAIANNDVYTKCLYAPEWHNTEKDRGPSNHCAVGDPINQANGNNFQVETDFRASGFEVYLQRTYNSKGEGSGLFGERWTSNFDKKISIPAEDQPARVVYALRPGGDKQQFIEEAVYGNQLSFPGGTRDTLKRLVDQDGKVTGWQYTTEDDSLERYDANGRLMSITSRAGLKLTLRYRPSGKLDYAEDNFGQRITFTVDDNGRVKEVRDPANRLYKYGYDGAGNLTTIEYPDTKILTHIYGELAHTSGVVQPHALTGIKDEQNIRFATIDYAANGWAIASEHALRTERTELTYSVVDGDMATETQVKTAGSPPVTYSNYVVDNVAQTSSVDRPCLSNPSAAEIHWAYPGQVSYMEDFRGGSRTSSYDDRGNEELRSENYNDLNGNTFETKFKWHPRWRLPVRVTRGSFKLESTYDPVTSGLKTMTLTDTATATKRVWTYKPDAYGRIREEDGPRTDVNDITQYNYYPDDHEFAGHLESVVNPLGHTTTFTSYDAVGNLLEYKDSNNQVTQFRYDKRDRLTRVIRNGQTVVMEYYDVGLLKSIKLLSTGRSVNYQYDDARRLTDITQSDGSRVHYTLDTNGKTQQTDVYDTSNVLSMTSGATFDDLHRLATATNARQQTTTFTPDSADGLLQISGPGEYWQSVFQDGLGRPEMIMGPKTGTVTLHHDVVGQIWKVVDANGRESRQQINTLGDVKSTTLPAPDGVIPLQTPDGAGNVATKVDYRNITETRFSDALNRLRSRSAGSSPPIGFTYDLGANAVGRLSGMQDGSGSYTFGYDAEGQLTSIARAVEGQTLTASFGYTNGDLTRVTYPSGRVVSYGYVGGYLRTVKINGVILAKDIAQHPSGVVLGWTWASGATYKRTRDKDGLVETYNLGTTTQTLGYDEQSQLQTITDSGNAAYNQVFGHDLAGRVTSYTGRDARGNLNANEGYTYDSNGNRTFHSAGGNNNPYFYAQGTNHLDMVFYPSPRQWQQVDNYTLSDGVNRFAMDDYGRIVGVTKGASTTRYLVNGFDQRVTKITSSGATTHYVYGPRGELLAEIDGSGATLKEYVWLPAEEDAYPIPIGVASGSEGTVNYIYTDHLGTPRMVTKPSGAVLWRWVSDPFGGGAPMESGLKLNLRFAGQYFDQEHGYHYNWHRYYDPATGRFISSDPFGIAGGLNTYEYAHSNPLMYIDPYGLFGWSDMPTLPQGMVDFAAGFGDSMTLGMTSYARQGLDIGSVNKCSKYYRNGQLADIAFEASTLGVSAGLKALAANASRAAARDGARPLINAYRKANDLKGGFVHHSNPLFGHPGGIATTFPTGGLPASLHSGSWNLAWFADSASHAAAHRRMRRLENTWSTMVNMPTIGIRAARDFADCSCR